MRYIGGLAGSALTAIFLFAGCMNSSANDADSAPAASAGDAALSRIDRTFLEKATAFGQREVERGRLAEARASNDTVKHYASRLTAAHTAANDELNAIIGRHHIVLADRAPQHERGSIGAKDDAITARSDGSRIAAPTPTGTTGASATVATTGEARARTQAGTADPWVSATGGAFDEGFIADRIKTHQDAIA